MKILPVLLLSLLATAAIAHGDHSHDTDASTPSPPKVGAKPEAKKADAAVTSEDKAKAEVDAAAESAKPAAKPP